MYSVEFTNVHAINERWFEQNVSTYGGRFVSLCCYVPVQAVTGLRIEKWDVVWGVGTKQILQSDE